MYLEPEILDQFNEEELAALFDRYGINPGFRKMQDLLRVYRIPADRQLIEELSSDPDVGRLNKLGVSDARKVIDKYNKSHEPTLINYLTWAPRPVESLFDKSIAKSDDTTIFHEWVEWLFEFNNVLSTFNRSEEFQTEMRDHVDDIDLSKYNSLVDNDKYTH